MRSRRADAKEDPPIPLGCGPGERIVVAGRSGAEPVGEDRVEAGALVLADDESPIVRRRSALVGLRAGAGRRGRRTLVRIGPQGISVTLR